MERCLALLTAMLATTTALAAEPLLVCKGHRSTVCTSAGCMQESEGSTTPNEFDIGRAPSDLIFCWGSACWRPVWSKRVWRDANQLTILYVGRATINRAHELQPIAVSIDTKTFEYQLSIPVDSDGVQVFFGDCACREGGPANRSCAPVRGR